MEPPDDRHLYGRLLEHLDDRAHTLFSRCGKNYGWSRFEGTRCQKAVEERDGPCAGADRSGFEFPYYEYCHVDYYSDRASEYDALDGIDICGDRLITGHAIIGKWSGVQEIS